MKNKKKTTEPDMIDYDGMGNYGRFPEEREPPTIIHNDIVIVVAALLIPVIYFMIR